MACRYAARSKVPSALRNFIRFRLARLHAVSSRNMYSLHGLEPKMRSVALQVCHLLMMVSYCVPGSAQAHAAKAIWSQRSFALYVFTIWPGVTRLVVLQSAPVFTAAMN